MAKQFGKSDIDKHLSKKQNQLFATDDLIVGDKHDNVKTYRELIANQEKIIYIPGNVPSLKNGKQIIPVPTGKTLCCNAKYNKLPDIIGPKGNIHQYECKTCKEVFPKLRTNPSMIPSKQHKAYKDNSQQYYLNNASKFLDLIKDLPFPLYVGFYFIRQSKRNWDWDNAITTCFDLLNHNGYIPEDHADIIVPVCLGYHHDKDYPGVVITPLKERPKMEYIWK